MWCEGGCGDEVVIRCGVGGGGDEVWCEGGCGDELCEVVMRCGVRVDVVMRW